MTIIVFLIDTSASMNQRTFIGARPTMLDIAKGAVETFVKVRTSRGGDCGPILRLSSLLRPPTQGMWRARVSSSAIGASEESPGVAQVPDQSRIKEGVQSERVRMRAKSGWLLASVLSYPADISFIYLPQYPVFTFREEALGSPRHRRYPTVPNRRAIS